MESKVLGHHVDCGGEVVYTSTASRGFRHCVECKASTLKGDPCDVVAPPPPSTTSEIGQLRADYERMCRVAAEWQGRFYAERDRRIAAQERVEELAAERDEAAASAEVLRELTS